MVPPFSTSEAVEYYLYRMEDIEVLTYTRTLVSTDITIEVPAGT